MSRFLRRGLLARLPPGCDCEWPKSATQLFSTCAIIALSTSVAQSQEAAENTGDATLETVIVTAQKREEALQDVPIGITAISGDKLKQMGAVNIEDYALSVPGMTYGEIGTGHLVSPSIRIRGIGSGGTVGYYVDETAMPIQDLQLVDIDRIEVLKGPQGTLYGALSMAGTLRVITNQPDPNEFSAFSDFGISTTQHGSESLIVEGMVNYPLLQDRAALRLTGYWHHLGGYVDEVPLDFDDNNPPNVPNPRASQRHDADVNQEEVRGMRAALRLDLAPGLTITPTIMVERRERDADGLFQPDVGDLLRIRRMVETPSARDFFLGSITVEKDLGWAQLVAIASYTSNDTTLTEDYTEFVGPPLGLPEFEPRLVTPFDSRFKDDGTLAEVRLVSSGEGPFGWLIGGFWNDTQFESDIFLQAPGLSEALGAPGAIPGDILAANNEFLDEQERGLFGEAKYQLTERFAATAGVRWYETSADTRQFRGGAVFEGIVDPDLHASEDGYVPKFALSYQATDDHLLYAQAVEGFRNGGVVSLIPEVCQSDLDDLGIDEIPRQFESDSLWNYEIGAKTTWLQRRLVANVAAFYIDWSDIQQFVLLPQCGFTITTNFGKAISQGLELEFAAQLTERLEVGGGIGYIDAELRTDSDIANTRKGDPMQVVPELTANGYAVYRFPFNDGLTGLLRADYQYQDEAVILRSILDSPDPLFRRFANQPGYDLLHLRMGVESNRWSLELYVHNALDERPVLGTNISSLGFIPFEQETNRPRSFGVTYRMRY